MKKFLCLSNYFILFIIIIILVGGGGGVDSLGPKNSHKLIKELVHNHFPDPWVDNSSLRVFLLFPSAEYTLEIPGWYVVKLLINAGEICENEGNRG